MKKIALTIAIVLGLSMTSFADYGGGLFQRGLTSDEDFYGMGYTNGFRTGTPLLPNHGGNDNQNAPVGTGIAVLTAFGAAYLVGKKRREE